jgi:CubicO group peptidase (beta-lactamase class C family)
MDGRIDFSKPADPAAAGVDPQKLIPLTELFDRQIAAGMHPAAQMVVLKDGRVIFERAGGQYNGVPITPDTPFYTFSVTKAFTGACIHKLIDEGKVSLDAPVAEYWPGFGKRGKQTITIRQVFLHLAGLPAVSRYDQIPLWPFWKLITASIAWMKPEYPPGTRMGYHAVTYGYILGEVVRRVSGLPIDRYFAQNFAGPLGMHNSWIKIPPSELKRAPRLISGCQDMNLLVNVFNLPVIRKACIPAASLYSTAREMAVFYQMLVEGGRYGGEQYLSPGTVEQATALGYRGEDYINQRESLFAYGFHLGGRETTEVEGECSFGARSTQHTFGHMGNRTCMAWGDARHRLVVAFTCNRLIGHEESRQRWISLNNAVWDAIGVF